MVRPSANNILGCTNNGNCEKVTEMYKEAKGDNSY